METSFICAAAVSVPEDELDDVDVVELDPEPLLLAAAEVDPDDAVVAEVDPDPDPMLVEVELVV